MPSSSAGRAGQVDRAEPMALLDLTATEALRACLELTGLSMSRLVCLAKLIEVTGIPTSVGMMDHHEFPPPCLDLVRRRGLR